MYILIVVAHVLHRVRLGLRRLVSPSLVTWNVARQVSFGSILRCQIPSVTKIVEVGQWGHAMNPTCQRVMRYCERHAQVLPLCVTDPREPLGAPGLKGGHRKAGADLPMPVRQPF